jgi:hypothetical protein
MRDQYGADFVSFIVNTRGYCGSAHRPEAVNEKRAFSMVSSYSNLFMGASFLTINGGLSNLINCLVDSLGLCYGSLYLYARTCTQFCKSKRAILLFLFRWCSLILGLSHPLGMSA